MQNKIPLIVAIIFGLIAFVGIREYLKRQEVVRQTVDILVFAREMPAGTRLSPSDLAVRSVPSDAVRSMAGILLPSDSATVINTEILGNVLGMEPVTRSVLKTGVGDLRTPNFSDLIDRGERAMSLPVDSAGMVTGLINPGDRVDILANVQVPIQTSRDVNTPGQGVYQVDEVQYEPTAIFLLDNVKVLAMGTNYITADGQQVGRSLGGNTITISVSPRQAQTLSFAMRNSRAEGGTPVTFNMILRSPLDNQPLDVRTPVGYDDIFKAFNLDEVLKPRTSTSRRK